MKRPQEIAKEEGLRCRCEPLWPLLQVLGNARQEFCPQGTAMLTVYPEGSQTVVPLCTCGFLYL